MDPVNLTDRTRMSSTTETPRLIDLQVGDKVFHTTTTTLSAAPRLVEALVPCGSSSTTVTASGGTTASKYFLDADPDVFRHVLEYLRQDTFPMLWNQRIGFDELLYADICRMASHYKIHVLADWIRYKEYKSVLKQRLIFFCVDERARFIAIADLPFPADVVFDPSESWIKPGQMIYHPGQDIGYVQDVRISASTEEEPGIEYRVVHVSSQIYVDFREFDRNPVRGFGEEDMGRRDA